MEAMVGILIVVGIAVVFRLMAGSIDTGRIESYVEEQGWTLLDKSWDPFGPGWFGEKDARIYQIVYRDARGAIHRAHVKTSMLSGVYLTNDRIVKDREAAPREHAKTNEELRTENDALRARIQELERQASAREDRG